MSRITKRKKKREKPEESNRRWLLGLLIIPIIIFTAIVIVPAATQSDDGTVTLGDVDCNVSLETVGYVNGSPAAISNNPFYFNGVVVDAIQFTITLDAQGSYVDWSTLSIKVTLYANDLQLTAWTWGTGLEKNAGSFSNTGSWMVDELDYLLTTPESVREDGVEVYKLDARAEVQGNIHDVKDNILSDGLIVKNSWSLLTDPNGVFSLISDVVTKPSFTSVPSDANTNHGDSHLLTWTATDDNPATFQIKTYTLADGWEIVASGTWANTTPMEYDTIAFGTIEPGDYTLKVTCTAIDNDGHTTSDSVQLNVKVPSGPTAPYFDGIALGATSAVADPTSEVLVTFKPRSDNPSSFKIYFNGVLEQSGSWSGNDISYLALGINVGMNRVVCVVVDTYDQENSQTHNIEGTSSGEGTDPGDPLLNNPFLQSAIPGISIVTVIALAGVGVFLLRRD